MSGNTKEVEKLLDPTAERTNASSNVIRTITITKFPILIAIGFFAVIIIILIMNSNNNASNEVVDTESQGASSSRSSAKVLTDNISDQGYKGRKVKDEVPIQTSGINQEVKTVTNTVYKSKEELNEYELKIRELRGEMLVSSLTSDIKAIKPKLAVNNNSNGGFQSNSSLNQQPIQDLDNDWLSQEEKRINLAMRNNSNDFANQSNSSHSALNMPPLNMPPLPTGGNTDYQSMGMGNMQNSVASMSSYAPNEAIKDRWTLDSKVTDLPKNPFIMQTGSIINATLQTEINSDLEGMITAVISQNVYDTLSGKYLLIPQGSRIIGEYGSAVDVGQRRLFVAWNRILFPDGRTLDIGEMAGSNTKGQSGFSDQLTTHFWRNMGNAVLLSLIGAGTSYAMDNSSNSNNNDNNNNGRSVSNALAENFASQIGSLSIEMIRQGMNMSPTIEIRSGYQFNVIITKDIIFDQPYNFRK